MGRRSLTMADMHQLAASRGLACLSRRYGGPYLPLRWRCAKGHEWASAPNYIHRGRGCPVCRAAAQMAARRSAQRGALAEARRLAAERGGSCLSKTYTTYKTRLRWRCAAGHEWEAHLSTIKHAKAWCPSCAGLARLTIDRLEAVAEARGGMLLWLIGADPKPRARTRARWRCASGHEWEAFVNKVLAGTWCPLCAGKKRPNLLTGTPARRHITNGSHV